MALIEWTEDLTLKIDIIDEQHRKLVDMINEFYFELNKKGNKKLVSELITKMTNYAQLHFKTEEELFSSYSYDDAGSHIKKHEDFTDKVKDLTNRYKTGKHILSFEITNFLKDWLINHIQKCDKEYADIIY